MDLIKHKKIFNVISPVYNLFFNNQVVKYSDILRQFETELDISKGDKILDIGCGTGAFAKTFLEAGYDVSGIDYAEKMVKYALRRGIPCNLGNIVEGLDIEDSTHHLVISAFVAHGIDREKRRKLFTECARLSKGKVLFHDYSINRSLPISIVEYLEDGDYFNFVKTGLSEMKEIFSKVQVIPVNKFNNWYICTPH